MAWLNRLSAKLVLEIYEIFDLDIESIGNPAQEIDPDAHLAALDLP